MCLLFYILMCFFVFHFFICFLFSLSGTIFESAWSRTEELGGRFDALRTLVSNKKSGEPWPKAALVKHMSKHKLPEGTLTGTIYEWSCTYGWITPNTVVEHDAASKHNGKVFLHASNFLSDTKYLKRDTNVVFLLYEDDKGLGACQCKVSPVPSNGRMKRQSPAVIGLPFKHTRLSLEPEMCTSGKCSARGVYGV